MLPSQNLHRTTQYSGIHLDRCHDPSLHALDASASHFLIADNISWTRNGPVTGDEQAMIKNLGKATLGRIAGPALDFTRLFIVVFNLVRRH